MSFTHGTIRLNSSAERLLHRRVLGELQALGHVEAHPFPDLLGPEPVPHQVAPLDHELLAVGELSRAQRSVVVPQRQPPERHVPRLVLHDVRQHLLDQRITGDVAVDAERRQRQPLDQRLHPQVGHIPARIAKRISQQRSQIRFFFLPNGAPYVPSDFEPVPHPGLGQ
jgi:hypothetical protein